MENIYYVYAYLREDCTPYYIGKGCNYRAYDKQHITKPPKNKSKIIFWQTGLLESDAHNLEIKYIKLFGRKDIGTGILRNLTNGGEGVSGFKQTEEHKEKVRLANIGQKRSEETKQKMRESALKRCPLTEKEKEKLRKPHGPMTEENKEKLRGLRGPLKKTRKSCGSLSEEHKQKMRGPRGPRNKGFIDGE